MIEILHDYRRLVPTVPDRVRWACALEATSPKVGNVHPSRQFTDLRAADFLIAGSLLADVIAEGGPLGSQILRAVTQCRQACGTNVNLGIALLIVPLAAAERAATSSPGGSSAPETERRREVRRVLENLTAEDCRDTWEAIRVAAPGGLGTAPEHDLRQPSPGDLMQAMSTASDRDLIARQYANAFADIYDLVVPALRSEIGQCGDILIGIRRAHVRVIATLGDTLISRKCGAATADFAMRQAARVVAIRDTALSPDDGADALAKQEVSATRAWAAEQEFDAWLCGDGHRRNPGATADLIAAGLFVLLDSHLYPHQSPTLP